jgi:antitoxin (DNA-binding transcriptional repressor) of toxin-antitoxin stability system
MTTHDYLMVMRTVKIAQLKSELSRHLREVRLGEPLTVLDRTTPVARLVPMDTGDDVVITLPTPGARTPGKVRLPAPPRVGKDIVTLLLAERQNHR